MFFLEYRMVDICSSLVKDHGSSPGFRAFETPEMVG